MQRPAQQAWNSFHGSRLPCSPMSDRFKLLNWPIVITTTCCITADECQKTSCFHVCGVVHNRWQQLSVVLAHYVLCLGAELCLTQFYGATMLAWLSSYSHFDSSFETIGIVFLITCLFLRWHLAVFLWLCVRSLYIFALMLSVAMVLSLVASLFLWLNY